MDTTMYDNKLINGYYEAGFMLMVYLWALPQGDFKKNDYHWANYVSTNYGSCGTERRFNRFKKDGDSTKFDCGDATAELHTDIYNKDIWIKRPSSFSYQEVVIKPPPKEEPEWLTSDQAPPLSFRNEKNENDGKSPKIDKTGKTELETGAPKAQLKQEEAVTPKKVERQNKFLRVAKATKQATEQRRHKRNVLKQLQQRTGKKEREMAVMQESEIQDAFSDPEGEVSL
jgi:hypothetical protein